MSETAQTPHFSVIVPAYNASATLRETLDSVAAQECAGWECVVVDDGSADDTADIVRAYRREDPRFVLVSQENRGTAGAYRTGVAEARADLLVICSADDMLLPVHLKVMQDLIARNPQCGIFSSNGVFLDDETGERRIAYADPEWRVERSLTIEQVIDQCFFSVGAVFTREVYDVTGGHRPGVYVDDYDLWLRAMARGMQHRYTPEVTAVHRVSSYQQSADVRRVWQSDISVYEHLREQGGLTSSAVEAIDGAIAERARNIDQYPAEMERRAVHDELDRQAAVLRARVGRMVGPTRVDMALRLIHMVSWLTIPVRRLLARRKRGDAS